MKKTTTIFLALLFVAFGVSVASAAIIDLQEWAFNIDGTNSHYENAGDNDPLPVNGASWNASTGLGTLTWTTNVAGQHSFIAYFDHEIDQGTNTFWNEHGTANGIPGAGQSWQLDDPSLGTIYDDVLAGTLLNMNYVETASQDVSMAMGWEDFDLLSGKKATITLSLSLTPPPSGFYLTQVDPDSLITIYFSGGLKIEDSGPHVPEPGTLMLLGTGLVGLLGWGKRRAIF